MRALEKPQEKSYRPPRALKLDTRFPTMKFELVPMLYFRDTILSLWTDIRVDMVGMNHDEVLTP